MSLPGDVPATMVLPSHKRKGIMRGGILQIQVTRACDLACFNCTQASNLGGKAAVMSPDEYEQALRSLGFGSGVPEDTYFGVVGMFGGNPAVHPKFEVLCEILRGLVPFEQRGIWCNNPLGKGKVMRETFDPSKSNLNVHLARAAYDEFARDWPESRRFLKGRDRDADHGAVFVAMKDVVPELDRRLELIGDCDINKEWSALIGTIPGLGIRAFFCEIAYTIAAMHCNNPDWDGTGSPFPDVGLPVEPGWWKKPLEDFAAQVQTCCHNCGIPLRMPPQKAINGAAEQFSETHRFVARPKKKDRKVEFVETIDLDARTGRASTEYLPGTSPRMKGRWT